MGGVVLTMLLVMAIGPLIFPEDYRDSHGITASQELRYSAQLGLIIAVVGLLGNLTLSSLKRDLGIKDFGSVIPGHGGLLDRFDSLILVAPAAFHFLNYVAGVGIREPFQIITGG